jgi:hypothetical protein
VFLPMKELVYSNLMSETEIPLYIKYYSYFVKASGETVRVAGEGFVDDILGLGTFYPQWGIWKETMIKSIWPYELHDLIKERRERGEAIQPRLEALAASVKTDDNPILVVARLRPPPSN